MRSIDECIEATQLALYSCANTVAVTRVVDDALKMAEATEKLADALIKLKALTLLESEDK